MTGKGQSAKRVTRYGYRNGPMFYLGQQIVRTMQDAGWPCYIHTCYRPPHVQRQVYEDGFSRAEPFESPHQYRMAVDIVHEKLHWNAPKEFWGDLGDAARIVAEKHRVVLDGGFKWRWDFAHIEVEDWKQFADRCEWARSPSQEQLDQWFAELLPREWAQYQRGKAAQRQRTRVSGQHDKQVQDQHLNAALERASLSGER